MDPVLQGAGRGGQDHPHTDRLGVEHRDILEHLELQHPFVELRVLDDSERLKDRFFSQESYRHDIILLGSTWLPGAHPPLRM